VPYTCGKACSDPLCAPRVDPVTCSVDVRDFGQLYSATINVFLKPDRNKMMFVLCVTGLVVTRRTKGFIATKRRLDISGLAD